ncbi:IclR family transcriptional regulator [Microbaculum marinum]|uniref:IclR family transcriptional regulator n=1 Tax=Microbaculum marinum TaxID=1764581 RepID=A0AAW9RD57_9HYPH
MQTVDKALKLLEFFRTDQPEIGLSDLARLAGYDKAATRRFLVALMGHAFIEQNPASRKYRLGAAFLHFAQVREATLPLATVVTPLLDALSAETGETAHASHYSAGALIAIGIRESSRANRVHLDPSEILPLHATASGLAFLAFGPAAPLEAAVDQGLRAYTAHTITDAAALRGAVAEVRRAGYAISNQGFEDEVVGIAMPFFDSSGTATGAIAVATPASRMSDELRVLILANLHKAALAATAGIGGIPAEAFVRAHGERRAA